MGIINRIEAIERAMALRRAKQRWPADYDIRAALDCAAMDYSIGEPPEVGAKIDRLRAALDSGDRSGLLPGDLDFTAGRAGRSE